MKYNKIYLVLVIFVGIIALTGCNSNTQTTPTGNVVADINDDSSKVTIYFFWGDGCPHCAAEKPFLEEMQAKYPEIEIKMFETWKNQDNVALFQKVAQAYGTTAQGVPTTFIGEEYWVGYADYMRQEMEAKIKSCLDNGCVNPGDKIN